MNKFRILIIDKDPATTNYLKLELGKADFEVYTANSTKEGLIHAYQQRPHVIIIDPIFSIEELDELLQKFKKDRRVSRTKVIAFSSLTRPQEIQSVIDLGLYAYLPKEGNALPGLIEKAKEAAELARTGTSPLRRTASASTPDQQEIAAPEYEPLGKTIVFLSSKGGVGTSSLCANIAHMVNQNLDKKVVVVDLVLPIGSIAAIVGDPETLDIVEASKMDSSTNLLDKLPRLENWNFRLVAGSSNPQESNEVDISHIPVILESLRKIADYTFVDLGKSLSRISMPIIKSADQIVITLALDLSTVAQTKAVWQYLKDQGITNEQVYFLINRSVGLEGLAKSQVEEEMGVVIPLALPYMGSNFTLANNLNQPISDKFPQDAVTISLRQAGDDIIRRIEEVKKMPDFF